jgi:putative DNA primase/helicase
MALIEQHQAYLAAHAVPIELAERLGVRSILTPADLPSELAWAGTHVPGILFPWTTPSGLVIPQYRPDSPPTDPKTERPKKYLFPLGSGSNIGQIKVASGPVLFVEGTKQALAAAACCPTRTAVYAIAGCRNWSVEGVPQADLEVVDGRDVFLIFDADLTTNPDVWLAASKFTAALKAEGADEIRYVILPAGNKAGLDDVLGSREPERRGLYLERLLEQAVKKLPKKPTRAAAGGNPFILPDQGGLQVRSLAAQINEDSPVALTQENRVAVYTGGVYRADGTGLIEAVGRHLGELTRPSHRAAVEEFLVGTLAGADRRLPMHATQPLMNVENGMVDLPSARLLEHDHLYLSSVQFPIKWQPDAECPTYEAWVISVAGDQVDDLEETFSQMLDPSRAPTKAAFLYGPSRSGKSTYLRLMEAIVGPGNRSAVTLHQLVDNRFAAANVYGKALNSAADLSAAHVEDLSIFKMMTGDDAIHADRKYGGQFTFHNHALFAFSANELPSVGENSRAYAERIKPFRFANSFAGMEDPTIESRMMDELPGILVRLVRAWQRRAARGAFRPTSPEVREEFETLSDRVRQWLDEDMEILPVAGPGAVVAAGEGETATRLSQIFNEWAKVNSVGILGRNKFAQRLTSNNGVQDVRIGAQKTRGYNVIRRRAGGSGGTSGTSSPPLPNMKTDAHPEKGTSKAGQGRLDSATSATTATGPSAFDLLLAELPPVAPPVCPGCDEPEVVVPIPAHAGYWFACKMCSPDTFPTDTED